MPRPKYFNRYKNVLTALFITNSFISAAVIAVSIPMIVHRGAQDIEKKDVIENSENGEFKSAST